MDATNIIKEWNERKEGIMSDAKEWGHVHVPALALLCMPKNKYIQKQILLELWRKDGEQNETD